MAEVEGLEEQEEGPQDGERRWHRVAPQAQATVNEVDDSPGPSTAWEPNRARLSRCLATNYVSGLPEVFLRVFLPAVSVARNP